MFKLFVPFAHAKSIYELPIDFFKSLECKYVISDLDNTLDSYKLYTPTEKAFELKRKLNEAGITLFIISNNKGKRVSSYANNLGVEYINSARKPFSFKICNFIKNKKLEKENIIFIGDQLITDVVAAKHAGLKVIFCDKLVKEDQFTTRFNRIFERIIKKYLNKRNLIPEWRDKYGNTNR